MYQQHVRHLATQDNSESPETIFLKDLEKASLGWQVEGDTVIVMADMNKDVRLATIQNMLRLVGLVDSPTSHHRQPPATHNQGILPIDGIFVPMTLIDQCSMGYLEFGDALPSNHRALWLDILAQSVCPLHHKAIEQPLAQCLHCRDPWVVEKYNELLWDSLNSSGLATRAETLIQQTTGRLTQKQQEEYKK